MFDTYEQQLKETIVSLSIEITDLKSKLADKQSEASLWYTDKMLETDKCEALQNENNKLRAEIIELKNQMEQEG